jgi:hypothetical protein
MCTLLILSTIHFLHVSSLVHRDDDRSWRVRRDSGHERFIFLWESHLSRLGRSEYDYQLYQLRILQLLYFITLFLIM